MATFIEWANELCGHVPRLPFPLAQKLVNRAWSDIRQERMWSWRVAFGQLIAPATITSGTVSVTLGTQTVTGNSAASTAWTGLSNPALTKRQFRVGSGGPIYLISGADFTTASAVVLTLDRTYGEATASAATYSIYRCYYEPPSTDFNRFLSVYDAANGYPLSLNHTRMEIDSRDPTRGAQGQPYWVATFDVDSTGRPRYELWPHPNPSAVLSYQVAYLKQGVDLVADEDTIPATLSESLLVNRSLWYAYQWAAENQYRFVELKGTNWITLRRDTYEYYKDDVRRAVKEDEQIFRMNLILPPWMRRQLSPVDSKFMQSHDIIGW